MSTCITKNNALRLALAFVAGVALMASVLPLASVSADRSGDGNDYFCKALGNPNDPSGWDKQTITPAEKQILEDGETEDAKDAGLIDDNGNNKNNIIPDFGDYIGFNWNEDFLGFSAQDIWSNDCNVPSIDYCDVSQRPGGMSIAQWHDENDFDGSECFEYEPVQQCGSLDVQFTENETDYNYSFRYVIGDETPVVTDWEGDGDLPVSFAEGEYDGSVEITYYVVGPESDFFVGSSIPNVWDSNGATVTVNTNCDDDHVVDPEPKVEIVGHKLVCEDESDLPQWSGSGATIDADTAAAYAADPDNDCEVTDWQFQWTDDQVPTTVEEDNSGELDGWNTFSGSETIEIDGFSKISVREVMQDNFLPFTAEEKSGAPSEPSAEFYCTGDVLNYDNLEYIDVSDGETYHCVAWNVDQEPEVEIVGHKLICEDASLLPGGSDGLMPIDGATAQDYADRVDGCELAEGWQFQWTTEEVMSAETDQMAEYLDGWNTSGETGADGSVSFFIKESELTNGSHVSLREAFQDDHIPFTRHGDFPAEQASAEFYCHDDGANFDNMEWIDVEVDNPYHCVAWNVPVEKDEEETFTFYGYKYEDESGEGERHEAMEALSGWEFQLIYTGGEDDQVFDSTTTDASGRYEFEITESSVPEGAEPADFYVVEVEQSNWTQTAIYGEFMGDTALISECALPSGGRSHDGGDVGMMVAEYPEESSEELRCDFLNTRDEVEEVSEPQQPAQRQSGNAANAVSATGAVAGAATSSEPEGEVLGETTRQCSPILNTYMRQNQTNEQQQVMILQAFLTGQGINTPMTGEFDSATDASVRAYQERHRAEILTPWFEAGLMSHENPTGYVYKLTRHKINDSICPGSEPMPELN